MVLILIYKREAVTHFILSDCSRENAEHDILKVNRESSRKDCFAVQKTWRFQSFLIRELLSIELNFCETGKHYFYFLVIITESSYKVALLPWENIISQPIFKLWTKAYSDYWYVLSQHPQVVSCGFKILNSENTYWTSTMYLQSAIPGTGNIKND